MKVVMYDIKDLTESKQMYETNIPRYGLILTYILLALLTLLLIWSIYSEIDINVKIKGIVRPESEIESIVNLLEGKIEDIYVKESEHVHKGQYLYKVDNSEYIQKKKLLTKRLSEYQKQLNSLNLLKESIANDTNLLKEGDINYYRYKSYIIGLSKIKKESEISYIKKENNVKDLKYQINLVESKIKKIDKNEIILKQLQLNIGKSELININKIKREYIDFIINELELYNQEITKKIKNTMISNNVQFDIIKKTIKVEIDNKINELSEAKNELVYEKSKIADQLKLLSDSEQNTKDDIEKYKYDTLVQIESEIGTINKEIENIKLNIDEIDMIIKNSVVRANEEGYIDYVIPISKGMLISREIEVAKIIPKENRRYKVIGYMQNTKGNQISVGDNAKVIFCVEKGIQILEGKVKGISKDIKVDEKTNQAYYEVEIELAPLKENISLNIGQMCDVNVIIGQKRLISWVKEKIGF